MDMEITYTVRTVNIREDGVTMVRGVFRYPCFDGNDIYVALANNCEAYLRGTLAPRAVQEYTASPSPKKRFFFNSYVYHFEVEVTEQDDTSLTCRLTVTLTHSMTKEILSHYESIHRHALPDLTFLPPLKKKPPKDSKNSKK